MTHRFSKFAVALAFASMLPAASATVLTFDDLPGTGAHFFLSNYNGFQFGSNDIATTAWFYTDEVSPYFLPTSETKFIATDASLYPANGSLQPAQAISNVTPFVFNGASFSDSPAFAAADQISYQLYLGSTPVYTSAPSAALTLAPQFVQSGFSGLVTSVVVVGRQGYYALDNFTYNEVPLAVPEPQAYALMLAGLVGVAAVARRRRNSRPIFHWRWLG